MLHSLHIIGSRRLGGAESFFLRLVKALNDLDHHASVVVRPGSALAGELDGKVEMHPVPMRNGWDLWSAAAIRRLVGKNTVDVVQTYMGRASRLTRLPKNSKAVHIARLGGYYKIDGYYRHADAWVGNTLGLCDYLVKQGLPADRVFYISNFVEPPRAVDKARIDGLRQAINLPEDVLVLFALGRFIKKKGFDDLIKAFSRVPAEVGGKRVHLVMAGDGPLRHELLDLVQALGLEDRFHWTGWLSDPAPCLQIADLFIVPSRHEPLGNVILEAWSYGLPVISTMSDGGRELVEDGRNGLLVPCGDPDALGSAISTWLCASSADRARLGETGRAVLEKRHSVEAITSAYLDLYRTVCRSGS